MSEHQLSARGVSDKLAAGEVEIVDVREPREWEAGRIAGARHIELNDLSARADEVDRECPVVFACRSGGRSAMATTAFREAGYEAYNLDGGLEAWRDAGLPLEPEDGQVV